MIPVSILSERAPSAAACVHHWVIDTPAGPRSRGICKRCGIVRDFDNALEGPVWEQDRQFAFSGWHDEAKPLPLTSDLEEPLGDA